MILTNCITLPDFNQIINFTHKKPDPGYQGRFWIYSPPADETASIYSSETYIVDFSSAFFLSFFHFFNDFLENTEV